jgi:anti-sigma B factor antagonist
MALKLNTFTVEEVAVLQCGGRIRFGEETAALRETFKQLLGNHKKIVLDLGGVEYIDSGGLGTLVGIYSSARVAGAEVKLANLTARIKDSLQITRLGSLFEFYDGQDQAVKAFGRSAA